MAQVRCNVCINEKSGICTAKHRGVKPNKPRICSAYTLDMAKVKETEEVPTIKMGYVLKQELKRRAKAEMAAIREAAKKGPSQGTAQDLGLIEKPSDGTLILPGDSRYFTPKDTKHPLTGDLSRFMTTVEETSGE